jgi:RNA polymerase sigma factor (sigma-70 family)
MSANNPVVSFVGVGVGEPSDVSLLHRYCEDRDMTAFDQLIDRHQVDLLRLAHALLADAHAAQDAVQESFMRLCDQGEALVRSAAHRASLGGWLATVVRNHCIDLLRRRAHARMRRLHEVAHAGGPGGEAPSDEEGLWGAVAALPPLERAAVAMRYRDGLSYHQIAERLGKTTTHVGVLLHQAIGRLRSAPALRAERS